jgi:histidine phosphotransferase ChpT
MAAPFDLMYLMCSKICHDLAAPLGAISIGLDMLPEKKDEIDSPINLLKQSVAAAVNKLELFRCLTGYTSTPNKPTLEDIHQLLLKQIDTEKYQLHWNIKSQDQVQGLPARLILALIMLAFEALPRGGSITLDKDFSVSCSGTYCKLFEATEAILNGNLEQLELNSRLIVPYFVYLICQEIGAKLTILHPKPNQITFRLS